jgi:hypothetical protein
MASNFIDIGGVFLVEYRNDPLYHTRPGVRQRRRLKERGVMRRPVYTGFVFPTRVGLNKRDRRQTG